MKELNWEQLNEVTGGARAIGIGLVVAATYDAAKAAGKAFLKYAKENAPANRSCSGQMSRNCNG
ncbi:hypothetical protein [Agaribacter flavus]|uniref:Class IIb bacteriocin, lactobin A/cerein 7B family n=1 Tax=Agaribacter flavus TaxID=1902781 RepID=A0ABV7FKS1_9ALTE